MQPETWWTRVSFDIIVNVAFITMRGTDDVAQIIQNTFQPLIGPGQQIHEELAPRLLHRFSSEEGYLLYSDVIPLIGRLQGNLNRAGSTRIIVGVITNSDPRVPSVLNSLGLKVSPARYNHAEQPPVGEKYDVDFTVMSYDVGHEKPDRRIFAAAEEMLKASPEAANTDLNMWDKVYVGDDFQKDVEGARNAGWKAVLVSREKPSEEQSVLWQDKLKSTDLLGAFEEADGRALGFNSLADFAQLLLERS